VALALKMLASSPSLIASAEQLKRVSHFFLWESHFYGSVVLTSSHEKCETRKQEFSENSNIEFYASQFYLFGWRNSSKWAELA